MSTACMALQHGYQLTSFIWNLEWATITNHINVHVYEWNQRPTFAVWDSIKQTEDKQGMVVIIGAVESTVHHV